MRGRVIRALAIIVASAAIVALPTAAAADSRFDSVMRSALSVATRRVVATQKKLPSGLFPYYTHGTSWATSGTRGWACAYFPGQLWASYELGDTPWFRTQAASRQKPIGKTPIILTSTDIGVRYYYSFARGYDLTGDSAYRAIALKAAAGEAKRFNAAVGAVRSLNTTGKFQVLIDEMMNLQILWWGSDHGGPASWRALAHRHAITAARDFVRPDGSVYHIVDYNPTTGAVVGHKHGQGYSEASVWSRGQAWAIYGFSAAYRETGDPTMLATARKVADRYLADVPADFVPYWDFRDPAIPHAPRDSSAAAIGASGLLDLATLDPDQANRARYESAAKSTLSSLASPAYFSRGLNPAILLHGTQDYWQPKTIDRGQSYGDYFFLEALTRLRRLPPETAPVPIQRTRASAGTFQTSLDGTGCASWASTGKQWLELDAANETTMSSVVLAVRYGQSRAMPLKVSVSRDRRHWKVVISAVSSGEMAGPENYAFKPETARYLRVVCNGTSRGRANGINEVAIH